MSEQLPVFTHLFNIGSDVSDKTVSISLGFEDGKGMQIDLSLGLVASIIAALSAEAGKLTASLPEQEREYAAPLTATNAWLSESIDGQPMLVFELANGTLLPLQIHSGDLSGLAAEMALLGAPKGTSH